MERNLLLAGSMLRSLLLLPLIACTGGPVAVNGGAVELDVNANTSNLSASRPDATDIATIGSGAQGVVLGVLAYEGTGDVRHKRWQLVIRLGSLPAAGDTYVIGSPATDLPLAPKGGTLLFDEQVVDGFRAWGSTGGELTIESRSGTRAELRWSAVPMAFTPNGTGNSATGTFELAGSVTVDDIEHAIQF